MAETALNQRIASQQNNQGHILKTVELEKCSMTTVTHFRILLSFSSSAPNLWEYLLELLNDKNATYKKIIDWKDEAKGVFLVKDTEVVAALWGLQRNKGGMNYDKMSRALRFYYTKGVISKVRRK